MLPAECASNLEQRAVYQLLPPHPPHAPLEPDWSLPCSGHCFLSLLVLALGPLESSWQGFLYHLPGFLLPWVWSLTQHCPTWCPGAGDNIFTVVLGNWTPGVTPCTNSIKVAGPQWPVEAGKQQNLWLLGPEGMWEVGGWDHSQFFSGIHQSQPCQAKGICLSGGPTCFLPSVAS